MMCWRKGRGEQLERGWDDRRRFVVDDDERVVGDGGERGCGLWKREEGGDL